MAPLTTSAPIQAFFPPAKKDHLSSSEIGDGFTADELNSVISPQVNGPWSPATDYREVEIVYIDPGPRCITFKGRIANLYDQTSGSKKPKAAKGCVRFVVKDDTGCITVRLWYANLEYSLRLGQIVTVWTPHVSNGEHGALTVSSVPLFTSIFPERDRSCHVRLQEVESAEFTSPLGYTDGQPLPWLMTLEQFGKGGDDVVHGRVLVCVKGVGVKKKVTSKSGISNDCVKINVFDDTAEGSLTLWGPLTSSSTGWKASHTILLLERVNCQIRGSFIGLSLTSNTIVDIDPDIPDAHWLRSFAQRLIKKEHINPPFPENAFDFKEFLNSSTKLLCNLADVDRLAREEPEAPLIGFLSLIVMEVNLVKLQRRTMLLCNQCCGIPIYANTIIAQCKHCDKPVELRPNPKLLGTMIDETGSTSTGKVLLSIKAWERLLGRSVEDLTKASLEVLKYLECRLLFLRLTLLFAWKADEDEGGFGRLWIWDVRL